MNEASDQPVNIVVVCVVHDLIRLADAEHWPPWTDCAPAMLLYRLPLLVLVTQVTGHLGHRGQWPIAPGGEGTP